jgi:predicted RNA methylase
MTKPNQANTALSISRPDLASALAQIGTEIDHRPLRSSALARIMRETFLGSDAGGAWDWRMAYDMMQAAAIQVLLCGEGAAGDISAARLLASRLLTETRWSEQQIRLQQFSTPLAFAGLAVRAAAIRKGETVLEPSAGTGALAAFAARAGATLLLNEIDPFRQSLLRAVFSGEVTGHDGEHIDDLLQAPVLPDVVLMNPPFASSVDRSRDKHIAAKHLIAAAKRLAPGGRLVAIMPPGFTPERDAAHWSRACGLLTPRLALKMPGQVYRKLGTSAETQLMVFDKVRDDGKMIRAIVCHPDEALPFVDAVAATRPEMRSAQRAEAIPHARPTAPSSAPRKTAASPVAASKPRAMPPSRFSSRALSPRATSRPSRTSMRVTVRSGSRLRVRRNMVAEPLRDETGALVVSREALALRDAAMMELMTLAPIPSALDQILWTFGDEAVAEVTGRSIRPRKAEDGHLFIEKRSLSSNSSETCASTQCRTKSSAAGRPSRSSRSSTAVSSRRAQARDSRWSRDQRERGDDLNRKGSRGITVPLFCVNLDWRSRHGSLAKATWQTGPDLPPPDSGDTARCFIKSVIGWCARL